MYHDVNGAPTAPSPPPQWKGRRPQALLAALEAQPVIGPAIRGLGDALFSALTDRTREHVALRVGAKRECTGTYLWAGHCFTAVGSVLDVDDVARVAIGPEACAGHDALVLRAVDALLDDGRLDRDVRDALGDECLGVIAATAMYSMVASIMQDVPPEPDTAVAPIETPAHARAYAGGT